MHFFLIPGKVGQHGFELFIDLVLVNCTVLTLINCFGVVLLHLVQIVTKLGKNVVDLVLVHVSETGCHSEVIVEVHFFFSEPHGKPLECA